MRLMNVLQERKIESKLKLDPKEPKSFNKPESSSSLKKSAGLKNKQRPKRLSLRVQFASKRS